MNCLERKRRQLRAAGGEYGAATGRPRRVGGFDVDCFQIWDKDAGLQLCGTYKAGCAFLYGKIPVCTAYEIDGNRVDTFPSGIEELKCAKPIYEYLPGFQCDISGCRTVDDLPKAALEYIRYIEKEIECPIKYVSVGAERDAYITMF